MFCSEGLALNRLSFYAPDEEEFMTMNSRKIKSTPPPGYKNVRDWQGLKVRTLRVLRTGMAEIPAGTFCVVTNCGTGIGLCLKTEPCHHCGVKLIIYRVLTSDVEVVASSPINTQSEK